MPKTIWKAEIEPNSLKDDAYRIDIPARLGARAISVASNPAGRVFVWFEVDPAEPVAELSVWCVGTGFGRVPDGLRFLGTVQQHGYVWHLYCE